MISVDIKGLIGRLNPYCTAAMEGAAGLCLSRSNYEVTVEHLLAKLIDDLQSDIPLVLRQFGVDLGLVKRALDQSIEEMKKGNAGKPTFSPILLELIQEGWLIASVDLYERKIRSGALLAAFVNRATFYATGSYVDLLREIPKERLVAELGNVADTSIERSVADSGDGGFAPGAPGAATGEPGAAGSAIARFCEDFTKKAADGKIDPVFGRDEEIRQMVDILARRRKNNPICVGDPGVGKTAVVEGLALRVTQGDVPDLLSGVTILGLDMGLLEAGASVKGEFEKRLRGVIDEIKASAKPIILFIDEAHTLIGAGGAAGGSDAANLLKPALARGELRTIAATTWAEYKKYFERDAALARRFQLVPLAEPSVETSVRIMRGLKDKYEEVHKVVVRDDAAKAAAELSARYISGRQLPDKAVDLLDTAAARVKVMMTAKPASLEDLERTIQALQREKAALERDQYNEAPYDVDRLAEIEPLVEKYDAERIELEARWIAERDAAHAVVAARIAYQALKGKAGDETPPTDEELAAAKATLDAAFTHLRAIQREEQLVYIEVDPDAVAKVVSDWTGVPLGKLQRDESTRVLELEKDLGARIKGQDHALASIGEIFRASKSGLKDPAQPIGVFLLVGPSGVGKTETALSVADQMFGGEESVVTINMSEFQEKHTVSRLVGSPPGYVGYGEGGVLTEAVRKRPYSVVLLDEVEKAHLDVLNIFYQVFDKGMLSDGEGRLINFKNTVLFLTSNLATDVITEMTANGETPDADTVMEAVRPILSEHFKPALLARMTVIPYFALPSSALRPIVELKLGKIKKRMLQTSKINFGWTEKVVDQITARCTEVETGARNIDYILNGTVLPQMSKEILGHLSTGAMPTEATLDLDSEGNFTIAFKE